MNKCKEKQKTTGGYEYGKNKIYRAEIVGYASEGSSIARIQDMVVFVPSGAVGDHCEIKIIKVAKKYAVGRIEKLLSHLKTELNRNVRRLPSVADAAIGISHMKKSFVQNPQRYMMLFGASAAWKCSRRQLLVQIAFTATATRHSIRSEEPKAVL